MSVEYMCFLLLEDRHFVQDIFLWNCLIMIRVCMLQEEGMLECIDAEVSCV